MTDGTGALRLGLGTVQFGLDYGITNASGRVPAAAVAQILDLAAGAGLDTLDTACLYGDSEAALGRAGAAARFRIVTKTPKFGEAASAEAAAGQLRAALATSLERLGAARVDALLLHDADDLTGPFGGALWSAMTQARDEGLVGKIGLSVYDGAQIDAALDAFPVEIVQLPWNPLDRRLDEGGQIARLAAAGVEVHARSLFLQGLLLQDPARIEPRFGPLRAAVAELRDWSRAHGLTPLEGVLALGLAHAQISRLIVGVAAAHELQGIVCAAEKVQGVQTDAIFASSAALDARYLNPARWSELS